MEGFYTLPVGEFGDVTLCKKLVWLFEHPVVHFDLRVCLYRLVFEIPEMQLAGFSNSAKRHVGLPSCEHLQVK